MTKIVMILTFVLAFNFISFGQTNKKGTTKNAETSKVEVDTSVIAIMKLDNSTNNFLGIFKSFRPTELTSNDLEKIETILLNFTKDYNRELKKLYEKLRAKFPDSDEFSELNFIIELSRYRRQYYAITNEKGEKEVWINCFCHSWGENWRKELIFVFDGGNCYFNLKINLETGKYYDVRVNGEA